MLTALDESFMHQVALPFELAATSVLDGFAAVQIDKARQHNLRLSRELRPDMTQTLGPLRIEVVEPFQELRFILEDGDVPFAFDLIFRRFLDAVLEDPHFHRASGRITQDYVRFNQLMAASGTLLIEGREIVADRWFGWRDHSWGVRPSVGGFEPPSPGVKDAFPSAARTGGKGMLLFYVGFNVGDELGGGIQIIENGLGDRIYLTGHFGTPDAQSRVVECENWSVETFPGTRMPSRLSVRARTEDGQVWDIVAEPTARPWGYKGFGYDAGYNDGKGQGVWRSAGLSVEQDSFDISDPEELIMPGDVRTRPNHREVHVKVMVNGREGRGYMPFIAIGDIAKLAG